jgi:AcrR family transcriptional regulator
LLHAARQLIRERGFENTTLQAVAERAGMTSGAIYGNFKNRNDLFIALGEAYWPSPRPKVRSDANLVERIDALADALIAVLPERADAVHGRLAGMSYGLTVQKMKSQIHAITTESYQLGAGWLAEASDLAVPADQLIVVLHALMEGLTFQRVLTPHLVSKDTIRAAFQVIATGAVAKHNRLNTGSKRLRRPKRRKRSGPDGGARDS